MEILFLVLAYVLYRWGHKHGKAEGKREAWREERVTMLEDFMYEQREKKDSK